MWLSFATLFLPNLERQSKNQSNHHSSTEKSSTEKSGITIMVYGFGSVRRAKFGEKHEKWISAVG